MSRDLPQAVIAALHAGRKIDAIRLLREHTGMGLAEAKAAVESFGRTGGAGTLAASDELPADAQAALRDDRKIEAVRIVREAYGVGLQDAKALVDRHQREHGGRLAAGDPVERGGRPLAGLLLVVLVVATLAAYWLL